jgi:diguanylate cyclase
MSEQSPTPAMRSEDAMRHTLATVLLAVDDAATLAQTRERLEAAGYRDVVSCDDSSRTEELLAAHEPDLLLLGAGKGAGTLEQLRANETWRQLPVIVLVPEHDSDAKRAALAAGATDLLVTPPDASELVLRLRNALAFKAYEDRLLKRDPLTGLANRTEFMRRVQAVLAREKAGASSVSLVLLDVDRFKQINDSLGHAGGDALLRLIAERLAALIARHAGGNRRADSDVPTPWLARLESDRFMALLPASPGNDRHDRTMQQLVESLAKPFHLARREFHVSASIGVASSPDHGSDVETLNRHAELALIQAKKRGGNAVEYFSAEMQTRASERLDFENHLRYAIRRGELRLFYQPKVDCASLRMVGVEALIRWQHPVHGLIPPQRFIPIAEEAGLIDEIGAWALQAACRQGARWLRSDLPAIQIAVNLSAAQLLQPGLAGELAVILRETGFPPARLTLELTESMLMAAGDDARRTIDSLKALGVALSLDDFGTGYSPLTYLRRLPIDEIKIDRSFVHGLPSQQESAAIAGAIIALAGALGLQVVAEGVETAAELEFLRGFPHCRFQGYLFSRPVPDDALTAMLQEMKDPTASAGANPLRDA